MIVRVAAAVIFWLGVLLLQKFNWGRGGANAIVLLAFLAATPAVTRLAARPLAAAAQAPRLLVIAASLLLALQLGYALKELRHPSLIDAATTTLDANGALRAGEDPYALPLDPVATALAGDARFGGYKYLPVTLGAYLPLGAPWGERGIVLTSLLLQGAAAWLVFGLALRLGDARAGWLALVLYLSLPLVPFQLFAKGALDLVAVVPLLGALLLLERRPGLAGLCLGLSLAAKPLPGALLLPCCLPAARRGRLAYAAGTALGLVPVLPFAVWSPAALFDNVVRFNLVRPPDSTSWLFTAPALAGMLAHGAIAFLYLAVALAVWRRPPTLAWRCGLGVMLMLAAILAAPAAHHNYQLWWLPLAAALLAAALADARLPNIASTLYVAPGRNADEEMSA